MKLLTHYLKALCTQPGFRAVPGSPNLVSVSLDSFNMDAFQSVTPLLTIIKGSLWLSEENLTIST